MSRAKQRGGLRRALPWLLPLLLCVPAVQMVLEVATTSWSKRFFHSLMHTSGEFGVRMMVLSLLATPVVRAWPGRAPGRWLRRHRRTFGLAAFGYGVLHFAFYLINETPWDLVVDLAKPFYIAGWVALLIMLPLAITSTKNWQKRLGKRWVRLHRLAYLVAIAMAVHWMLKKGSVVSPPVLLHFVPLLLLQANRWRLSRKP